MTNIQKLLEEESKLCKECCGGCYHLNKDILKAVIPLLREMYLLEQQKFDADDESLAIPKFIKYLSSLTSSSDKI